VSFSSFLLGLSTQALLHLGEIEDPASGRVERDLGAAKLVIDILGILQAKTKGNLEQAEDQLLDAVLYDLRMRYVELVRGPSREGAGGGGRVGGGSLQRRSSDSWWVSR